MAGLNRAVFLDRDGTINEELSYLAELTRLRLIEGATSSTSNRSLGTSSPSQSRACVAK